MLTKKQFEILGVFHGRPFSKLTFKEIKRSSQQKSNNAVQVALKKFEDEDLLITESVGNVNRYSLNFKNNLVLSYLNLINEFKVLKSNLPLETIRTIGDKILEQTVFFVYGVFGSFAKNLARKDSDIDIFILVKESDMKSDIGPVIETINRREIREIDYQIISLSEFEKMLASKQENLGKQIYRENIICYGYIEYLNLIKKF